MYRCIQQIITNIKHAAPLILNITNAVTVEFIANGLLSVGASPIMSQAPQEAADLMRLTSAVVVNPGTLNDEFIELSHAVCLAANALDKPIILDPVGAGASDYRTLHCRRLLAEFSPAIIRGNASEIMALAGQSVSTKGVDSSAEAPLAVESAQVIAKQFNNTVIISGQVDVIVDSTRVHYVRRGSSIMPMVTGTGCLLSAVVGAFSAVHGNLFEAACAATEFYAVCGELAERLSTKPGSFRMHFLDSLSLLPEQIDYA